MATPFLSSEEYDERAHRHYNAGDYDRAIETLKEGLVLYPNAADLYVGLGYTRLAREEFAWAKHAFEEALALEPDHDDARVGLGEVLLRFGHTVAALDLFEQVRRAGTADDLELLLSMGRALYREGLDDAARDIFVEAIELYPESADAVAAHAYCLHRIGEETRAIRELGRALRLDPTHLEARIYLAHLHYDRGEWELALHEFEQIPPSDHWDSLAVWRVLELKRLFQHAAPGDPRLIAWEMRLEELEADLDPVDELLAEVEHRVAARSDSSYVGPHDEVHRLLTPEGHVFSGCWIDIVRQLRDALGSPEETIAQFMRRYAEEQRARTGIGIPSDDAEAFLRANAHVGLWRIES